MTDIPKKVIYVNYYDNIDDNKTKSIMAAISELYNREKPDAIYFLFSSTGGLINPGIALYNFLRALPVEIIMHNTGNVESIGNIVFMAGDIRYASIHSSFLFHGTTWSFPGATTLQKNQVSEMLSNISTCDAKISGIITDRTKLTNREIRRLFVQGASKDAAFALAKGVVSEIKDPQIPKGTNILSFNLT